ncbi:A/G-specific adenine glycosylase [Lactovum odontotermitis]
MNWKKAKINDFQLSLLNWYRVNQRSLPWRKTRDPYKVWVSEIMSQQTQVETVIPYYERFVKKYPAISDLANADDAELLKLWEGLGYYSRARNLKSGAQQMMSEFDGEFPQEIDKIRSIKGIGPYTAASIASICFGQAEPAIDGNLFRVGSRIFEISDDISKSATRKVFDMKFRPLMSHHQDAGNFNQALMDIGAMICHPKSPKCEICPISAYCAAFEHGTQENFPVKSKKIKQKDVYYQAFAVKSGEKFLMSQRPSDGLLADMWTFPLRETAENAAVELPADLSNRVVKFAEVGEITHVFSHLKWHVRLVVCQLESGLVQEETSLYNQKWLSEKDLKKHALAGPQIKLFRLLKNPERLNT